MNDDNLKEVRFDKYCKNCKYWSDGAEPIFLIEFSGTSCNKAIKAINIAPIAKEIIYCDECLEESMRYGTEVPLKWEKK